MKEMPSEKPVHVCMGCGRNLTAHPSSLCKQCYHSHDPEEGDRASEDVALDSEDHIDKRRILPGPPAEPEDAE